MAQPVNDRGGSSAAGPAPDVSPPVGRVSSLLLGWVGALLAGVALGTANSLSNAFGSAYGPFSASPGHGVLWLEYLSAWLGTAWAWALFAFVVGWLSPTPGKAAARAVFGLLAAVVAYYVCDAALRVNTQLSTGEIAFWSVIATLVGTLMALVGLAARDRRRVSLYAALAMPALIVFDTLARPSGPDHIRPWAQLLVLGAAAALAAAFIVRAVRPADG